MRNCAVICLTKTWLNDNMPDSAFQLAGRQLFRADRNQLSGKARGGRLMRLHKQRLVHKLCAGKRPVLRDIPTRVNNTLDRVYTNVRDAYRAVPHPHLGLSDHISIMLVPAYHPPLRRSGPTQKLCCRTVSAAQTGRSSGEAAESEGELDLEDLHICCPWVHQQVCGGCHPTTKTVTCYHETRNPGLNVRGCVLY
ncbi:hypothetical protein NFI96_028298 [Prochilodus magdalenae]|nr:hypothetical protein NFI96_028298 [Prochilodus magdalenae]